jgi:bifunctional non-homologous end joining protein LigD
MRSTRASPRQFRKHTSGMLARLAQRLQHASPFDAGDASHEPQIHWVRPQLVAEIAFGGWTQNGLLRQPRFEGLRTDKTPRQCRRSQIMMS